VFYLRYVRSELLRRRTRTILTLLGLALGVALVIAITGLTHGLDRAQKTALNPLSTIGTDLTVTLSPQQNAGGFGGGGGGGDLIAANQSAITDLSKLGKPGTHFVHDFFLPGTQLTFPQSQAKQIANLSGVAAATPGLVLSAVHQEGTVPKIVARIRTGGRRLTVRGRLRFNFSAAQQEKIRSCFQKYFQQNGGLPAQGGGRLGGRGGAGGPGGFANSPIARKCLPAQVRNFARTITTPQQTLQQIVNPPQTNITSSSYSIAGVDSAQRTIGVVTPPLVTRGHFFTGSNKTQALVAQSYAKRHSLRLGSVLDLNGTKFRIVGLVKPPLGGQSADVYIPIARLQKLASQSKAANVVLVRADKSSDVAGVQKEIEQAFPNAQVASASQVADSITGSLVDASKLARSLGVVLAILAAVAAFLLAALLTLVSVGKRVRELGTLKALGWSQRLVVRQVVAECLATGVVGGLVGVVLGVFAALAVDAFGPSLNASSTSGGGSLFGLGQALSRTASTTVSLHAPLSAGLLALGFVLALAGGLVAGTAGAVRAARLRPADALRQVE
jgi:ABC-type antimicrobial peptide transport system permease subunit